MTPRKRSLVPPLVAAALALTGCQQTPSNGAKPVALDQAKQQSVELHGGATFVPPPRSIDTVLAQLNTIQPPTEELAKWRTEASAEPSPDLGTFGRMRFLYNRIVVRVKLGRLNDARDDVEQLMNLVRNSSSLPTSAKPDIYNSVGRALLEVGFPQKALDIHLERIKLRLWTSEGSRFYAETAPGEEYVALGRLKEADELIKRQEPILDEIRQQYETQDIRDYILFYIYQQSFEDIRGRLELARGNYAPAESAFRLALGQSEKATDHWADYHLSYGDQSIFRIQSELIRQKLALTLAEQGKLAEAEVTARQSLINLLKIEGKAASFTADAVLNLAAVLDDENRTEDAAKLADAALKIYHAAGLDNSSWVVVAANTTLADYRIREDDWAGALAKYDEVDQVLKSDPEGRAKFLDHNANYALALLGAGRGKDALAVMDGTVQFWTGVAGDRHRATGEAIGLRGVVLERLGERERALADFQAALAILRSGPASESDGKHGYTLRVILQGYLRLLSEIGQSALSAKIDNDVADESFEIADLARGQSVQRAITQATARLHIADPKVAELARREQDTTANIAALEGVLVQVASSGQDEHEAVTQLRANIEYLKGQQKDLLKTIETAAPSYAALIDPKPPSIAQVQAALHPGEAFVSTYSLDDRTLIWAIPKTGTPMFVSSGVKSADLAAAAATLRGALDPQASTLADIPPFDVSAAHKLYAGLLEPAIAGWKDAKSLVIASDWLDRVPAGLLVTQPVSQPEDKQGEALFSGYRSVPFLVRQVSVAQVPSAATLVTLRSLPQGAAARQAFVGFGDPVFTAQQAAQEKADLANATQAAPQQVAMTETRGIKLRAAPKVDKLSHADLSMVPRLPDTAQELREVATTLKADPATDLFLGPAANEHQVETMKLDDRRVVMFATHGLVPGDLDGLTQPALALSAPALSGTDGDGLLTMDKIMGLKLDADWVVLSACNTGAGEERGAEAVSGLGRAFFYAGARAVLVTNWPVETNAARFLTTAAFRHQSQEPGINRAEALRQSELDLIGSDYRGNDGKPIFSYAHPLFWAPFTLVGDEG